MAGKSYWWMICLQTKTQQGKENYYKRKLINNTLIKK